MSRSAFLHGIGDFIVSSLPPLMTRTVLGRRYPKFGSGVQNIAVYLRLGRGSRINAIIQCTGRLHEILNGMFDFIVSNVSPLITWTAWGGRCPNIVVLCFFILAAGSQKNNLIMGVGRLHRCEFDLFYEMFDYMLSDVSCRRY